MKKIKTYKLVLIALVALNILFFSTASADNGVHFGYTIDDNGVAPLGYFAGTLKAGGISRNIEWWELDESFPGRVVGTTTYPAMLKVEGVLRIEKAGYYRLYSWQQGMSTLDLSLKDKTGKIVYRAASLNACGTNFPACTSTMTNFGACCLNIYNHWQYPVYFPVGDYRLAIRYAVSTTAAAGNTRYVLQWNYDTTTDNFISGTDNNVIIADTAVRSLFKTIPSEHLNSFYYDNSEIQIPAGGGDEMMDYLAAGVGVEDQIASGRDPHLLIQLPETITTESIRKDDGVWIFWMNGVSDNITIKNEVSGVSRNLDGQYFKAGPNHDLELDWVKAKLPNTAGLFDTDPSGRLHYSFHNLNSNYKDGIALILAYNDPRKPMGYLRLRLFGGAAYNSASPPITYSGLRGRDHNNYRPFFVFPDGQDLFTFEYRPNYIAYSYGTGTGPGNGDLFGMPYAKNKLVPEKAGPASVSGSSDYWYPAFGREGMQIDVIAAAGNYTPNLAYNSDVTRGSIDDFVLPEGTNWDWVSFQYVSSFFPETANSTPLGTNESGGPIIFGMQSFFKAPRILACPDNFEIYVGDVKEIITPDPGLNIKVYYWKNKFIAPTCSNLVPGDPSYDLELDISKKDITGDVNAWRSDDESKLKYFDIVDSPDKVEGIGRGVANLIARYWDAQSEMWLEANVQANVLSGARLIICPNLLDVTKGSTGQAKAYYWSKRILPPTCGDISTGTEVTAHPNIDWTTPPLSPAIISLPYDVGAGPKGEVKGENAGMTTLNAQYTDATGEILNASAVVNVQVVTTCSIIKCNLSNFQCEGTTEAQPCTSFTDPACGSATDTCYERKPWTEVIP